MILKTEQINKFIELHKNCAGFESYTEDQKREIANGVANFYITLFNIQQRSLKESIIKQTS